MTRPTVRGALFAALLLLLIAPSAARAQDRVIAVGQAAGGELSASDPVGRRRHTPYHLWTLEGRRGQRLTIDLMSADFDAYLVLRDADGVVLGQNDDGGEDRNARLRTVLPRDGRFLVIVTAFSDSARGRYTLAVSGWETPEAAPPGATLAIAPGETRTGMLEPGDAFAGDGPFEDRWMLAARAGQRLRIDMTSEDLDSYLVLLGPGGERLAFDDDGGEGNSASIGFRAAAAGRYTVVASSFGDNVQSGAYRLTVVEESGDFPDPGAVTAIATGQTKEGRLEAGDPTGRRGPEDRFTFTGRAGQLARVDVTSEAFDSYAMLRFGETPVDSNDDGGGGNNARLMTVLPQTGTYTLVVSPYSSSSTGGRYRVALAVSDAPAGAGRIERIAVGQRVSGRLEAGDRPRSGGGWVDAWEFDGRSGQDVIIEMHSGDFDAYLELQDPEGAVIAENDDGGDGTDALVVRRLERNGRYRILARAYGDHEASGLYELSLSLGGDVLRAGRTGELRLGQVAMGRLEAGDSLVGDSTYADVFTFRAAAAGEIVVELRSGDFDAYLIIKDGDGGTLATDDDGGDGTDSRITLSVQAGRTYRIYANSYGQDRATGLYRLSARPTY